MIVAVLNFIGGAFALFAGAAVSAAGQGWLVGGPTVLTGLAMVGAGALFAALSAACHALRDIARNSFQWTQQK
jgi:hypothetical protein